MPGLEKHMIDEKRGTWWAVDPKKGKKGFATKKEAEAWLGSKKEEKDVPTPEDKDLFAADA